MDPPLIELAAARPKDDVLQRLAAVNVAVREAWLYEALMFVVSSPSGPEIVPSRLDAPFDS
jgi:hypothetical protein